MKYNIKLQGKQAEAQNQRNQRDLSTELIDLWFNSAGDSDELQSTNN